MSETRSGIRYAIYTRQSADTTADFSSCDAQFAVCSDFATETGEPHVSWCGQRFDDQGYSGATLERPALRRLRKVIDLGGIDRLYAVALDRLSRKLQDTIVLLDEFDRAGVELCLVHQPELGQAAESRFLRHILASFAEFERERIATRIAETRAYLKQPGRRLAGPLPFGYDADPDTKQLVPNRIEARRIRAIFKRAVAGHSLLLWSPHHAGVRRPAIVQAVSTFRGVAAAVLACALAQRYLQAFLSFAACRCRPRVALRTVRLAPAVAAAEAAPRRTRLGLVHR